MVVSSRNIPVMELSRPQGSNRKKVKKKCTLLFNPFGKFKYFWDNLNLVLILYVAFVTPFKFAFVGQNEYPLWNFAEYFLDIFFFLDIIITFFMPIYLKNTVVEDHWIIAKEYLKFWFWLDFVSVFPVQLVISDIPGGASILATLFKTPRLYKTLKISKISRTLRLRKNKENFIIKLYKLLGGGNSFLISILPLYIVVFMTAHVFGCVWYF